MDVTQEILSEITTYMKYAKFVTELNRRETWEELVTRNKKMHQEKFPQLKLIADFSHFCVVSESNLEDQRALLEQVYPTIKHIHARIGFEQAPQVNNPFAPEWEYYLKQYTYWWKEIIAINKNRQEEYISITPEFGPYPYMPQEPFSLKPLSNQWEVNIAMKKYLQENLS